VRLAFSKGPERVGVSFTSPEDESRFNIRNVVFSGDLEFRTTKKVHKPMILIDISVDLNKIARILKQPHFATELL
jgi:hypothetical protein